MINILAVFVGGGLGSLLRFATYKIFENKGGLFPLSTFLANATSSLILGIAVYLFMHYFKSSHAWSLFFTIGICGGFSTFSTFSIETLQLFQSGATGVAILNIAVSVMACIVAILVGFQIGKWVLQVV